MSYAVSTTGSKSELSYKYAQYNYMYACVDKYMYVEWTRSLLTYDLADVSFFQGVKCTVFVNLGPCKCVLIRKVSSFQRVKCMVFVNLRPCLTREVASFQRCPL